MHADGNLECDAGHDADVNDAPAVTDTSFDTSPSFVIAMDPGGPSDIALDRDYVYWTTYFPATIKRVAKGGGTPQLLANIQNFGNPTLDVDDTAVYFTALDDSGVTSYVGSVPKGGGAVAVIAAQRYSASRVKVAGGFVYWLDQPSANVGVVARAPVGGGAVQSVTPTMPARVGRLAVDDQFVYWTDDGDQGPTSGHIYRASQDGTGAVATLVSSIDSPWGIAIDATNLFAVVGTHVNPSNGSWNGGCLTLSKLATPPATTTVLAGNQAQPLAVAVDETSVYWGNHSAGTLMKVAKTGGPATVVANGSGFESVAVDEQYVYWIFNSVGNGYVARAPKAP